MCCGNANGDYMPDYILFKGKHLYDSYTKNGPEGAHYNTSKNGWMESEHFAEWFEHVFLPTIKEIPGKHLLIMDQHSSHINLKVIDLAIENEVALLTFKPKTTHRMQPYDVAVFGPVKKAWSKVVENHFIKSGYDCVGKEAFAELFALIKKSGKGFQRRHLIAGFETTGNFT